MAQTESTPLLPLPALATYVEPEEVPVLKQQRKEPNPLPWIQLSTILTVQFCNALTPLSILPYINQLVAELDIIGGDQRKVGYYVGIIESSYPAASILTGYYWNRLSDRIGRKPVLLLGLAGSIVCRLWFGLSRSFSSLVASQCVGGLLYGNVGAAKSVVREITDSTNRARGFSFLPVAWSIGGVVASLIGGSLAKPRNGLTFSSDPWKEYPYLLPPLTVSAIIAVAFLVVLLGFQETVLGKRSSPAADENLVSSPSHDQPVAFRDLLTFPVIICILNYMAFDFIFISQSSRPICASRQPANAR